MSIKGIPPEGLRPMSDFDPSQPAILHDVLTDKILTWDWARAEDFRNNAVTDQSGRVAWDGMILDGWGNVLGG
jgi:hypothetical protein